MGNRINTIMQTCFFAISGVLPREEAIEQIKKAIKKTYGKRGDAVVQQNYAAVDAALAHLHEVKPPDAVTATFDILPAIPAAGARLRARRPRRHGCRPRRPAARQRPARRRNLPHRHREMGEAQHRPVHPRLGSGPLHPVRQVRHGLPARRHPRQGLRLRRSCPALPPPSSPPSRSGAAWTASSTPSRSRPKTAPAASSASKSAPRRARPTPPTRPSTWLPQQPLRVPERANWEFFENAALGRPRSPLARPGQGHPAPRAALRVLRRLRRAAAKRPTSSCSPSSSATAS